MNDIARDVFITFTGKTVRFGKTTTVNNVERITCESTCLGGPSCYGFIFQSKCPLIKYDPFVGAPQVAEDSCTAVGAYCTFLDSGALDQALFDAEELVMPNLTTWLSTTLTTDGDILRNDQSVVWKVKHEFCRATVAGAGDADGKYIKDESTTGVFHTGNYGYQL